MAGHIACLRGWHPALAKAELSALLPDNEIGNLSSPRLVYISGELAIKQAIEAMEYSSGTQAILLDFITMDWDGKEITKQNFLLEVSKLLENCGKKGSIGVFSWRQEGRINGFSASEVAGLIGGIATRLGFSINLQNPDHKIGLVLDGLSQKVVCGWMVGYGTDSDGTTARKATERPFFKPISLDPRLARLAVNLVSKPRSMEAILDPMTGTGGFAIEAATMGRNVIALDLDLEMVKGAKINVDWSLGDLKLESTIEILQGDATNLSKSIPTKWHQRVSGLVLDPPYGRNSHGSLSHTELIKNTLLSFHDIATRDAKMVLILPIHPIKILKSESLDEMQDVELLHGQWNDFSEMLIQSGWKTEGRWVEHVHSSLNRLILHASIVPQDLEGSQHLLQ
jgi:putative methyltransferase (TIGR01177 family)